MKILGLDIGASSVGSAWVDTSAQQITLGNSVFPAGVEEHNDGRRTPKNKARREARAQRNQTRRRARRKQQLRQLLLDWGWMPRDPDARKTWLEQNPWGLRRRGLEEELTCEEFGRVLLHLTQRRGASWFDDEDEEQPKAAGARASKRDSGRADDAGTARQAAERLAADIKPTETFGQFMANLLDASERHLDSGASHRTPVRNRNDSLGSPQWRYCPTRQMIRREFELLWTKQQSFTGKLAEQLTQARKDQLDQPGGSASSPAWRDRGVLFGQRNTYWRTSTLGRCDLEPAERVCPHADMYAQEFLVLEDVNKLRVHYPGRANPTLTQEERRQVAEAFSKQATATVATVLKALALPKAVREQVTLNVDVGTRFNTNWFAREIQAALGSERWEALGERGRDAVNRAVLKFNPADPAHVERLQGGCQRWWGLTEPEAQAFVNAWRKRPNISKRVNLSRRALRNLLPYLRNGLSVTEARQQFADDPSSSASPEQRGRYSLGAKP